MLDLLWLIPLLPFAGFFALSMTGSHLAPRTVAAIGTGSVALSAFLSLLSAVSFIVSPPPGQIYSQPLWTWLKVSGLDIGITFSLDPLSAVMMLVITIVASLIHLYSVEYMSGEEGYSRFFAYMNLFVGSMLILVLADNLLLLYLGWEGVGLCSYLLIGFWYKDPANGYAARKAFVVTRVGDIALALGIFLLYTSFGTLQIQDVLHQISQKWQYGSVFATAAAFLILGGAVGKSAQLPLQTWLPDAMAGPTPVSALIHAATMVTAGVYLIARTNGIFLLAPSAMMATAIIGSVTLLLAGASALTQRDIKRVLAYSTISQIGYMFLALGVGAWSAAIFHFMVHAFFKALLFLGAGVIISSLHHERDMFKMGGLRKQLPLVYWTFIAGSASLSAVPFVSAGFYSKDLILWQAWSSSSGSAWLWLAGLTGAFFTSLYTFRMVFLVFHGEKKSRLKKNPSLALSIPLIILAVFSLLSGFIEVPSSLGGVPFFSEFVKPALPTPVPGRHSGSEFLLQLTASVVSLSGIYFAYLFFRKKPRLAQAVSASSAGAVLSRFWSSGWGFDWLYNALIVSPLLWLTRINKHDFIDLVYEGIAWYTESSHRMLSLTQTGSLRWYAASIVFGVVLMLAVVVLL
jgi:NADH-quinone oxidoreductase subunit L